MTQFNLLLDTHMIPWNTERRESRTVGGVFHPERGALVYREKVEETVIKGEEGSEFTSKKITRVTSETRRLGEMKKPPSKTGMKQPLLEATDGGKSKPQWSNETSQIEANPLYSSNDYVTDFSNPLYTNRHSTAEAAALAASEQIELDDMAPLMGSGGAKPKKGSGEHEEEVDVLY